ncbi:P-loop containing nucleoside triphosphate hydrolase protein [Mycena galopus ATCC 62051]|nr:P-loop containing nucleoside triphosphate hydrolase protein [Mycena galopus ATCC 62051]
MNEPNAFDALSDPLPAVDSREWMDALLRSRCKISKLWPHQLELAMQINQNKDVFCVVATGMGKTVVLQAGPIAADARGETAIGLIIVPTKVLVEQQAEVATARGLRALPINEDTVREAALERRDLWAELVRGKDVRVAIKTPQMALGKRMQQLLNSPAFVTLVRWVSVDEAGLIDQKDGVFASWYCRLATLRVKLLTSTQWTAATASATKERAPVMARGYGMRPGAYFDGRYSINRPNLKYIPRFYQHAYTGAEHLDLSFVILPGMKHAWDIVLTVIFAKTIERGFSIMQYLDNLIPFDIPNRSSPIKLYNSLMSSAYRRKLKSDFEAGKVRVILVTDTAAYGFDVSNVRRVITTDLEDYYEESDQKFGRSGRDGQLAEVIAFAPSWVQNSPPGTVPSTKGKQEEEEKRAKLREPLRAFYNPTMDCSSRQAVLHYYSEPYIASIPDVETNNNDLSRVEEWRAHFEQARATDEHTSTVRLQTIGAFRVLDKAMQNSLSDMLRRWSSQFWARIRPSRDLPCSCFFPSFILEAVVDKSHLCIDLENLKLITKGWEHFAVCGPRLLAFMIKVMAEFDKMQTPVGGASLDAGDQIKLTDDALTLYRLANMDILKALCRENDCTISGKKMELVQRLMLHFARCAGLIV